MSSVIFHLPPPMQKRAFQLMLARAKQVQDEGESVLLTHCDQPSGTCSSNLMGNSVVCAACRHSTRKSAEDAGLELVPLRMPEQDETSQQLSWHENKDIAEGVHSCLITVLRVMKQDLNRIPLMRNIKRRNFQTAAILLQALRGLLQRTQVHRIEVLNGRYACMKVGVIAAREFGIEFNTLDFSCIGKPMVFRGHTPHDRAAIQARVRGNPIDMEVASDYYEGRRDSRYNQFAKKHTYAELPDVGDRVEKRVTFFLSSQDECESLGPEWRSPFRDTASVVRQACLAYPHFSFCVRFHPNQANILSDIDSDYRSLVELPNLRIYYPRDEINSYRLVEWSDVVVTFASTVAIEACWSRKAVIQLGPSFFDQLNISYTPGTTKEFLTLLGDDLQAWPIESAVRFAHYDLYDFDEISYLDYSSGEGKPVGFGRKASVVASVAKNTNILATNLLKTYLSCRISLNRKAA